MADKKLLITRPRHDIVTFYLFKWSKALIELAKDRNLEVVDLDKDKASREDFESYLDSTDPRLVVLNGHGGSSTVAGHEDEPILEAGDNEGKTKDRILYVRTCKSARRLGKTCVGEGDADAFIGYKGDFALIRDSRKTSDPLNDETASPIMEASNKAPRQLIKGKKAENAYISSQKAHTEKLREVISGYTLGKREIFNALASNKENQTLIGNSDASL
ncbi:MAG: hypothetical protein SVV03_06550 [Candidatus Nanohaloarchaea archaeon]|nr:hypothetical protein [Candidatus Nanohaloarchaea archaeon]